jgi:hypothetical protein
VPEALVQAGRWLRWIDADGQIVDERIIEPQVAVAAERLAGGLRGASADLVEWVRPHAGNAPVEVSDKDVLEWLTQRGIACRMVSPSERRRVREAAFRPDRSDRVLWLAVARQRLQQAMRSPEATLSALAREEERVERVLRRENNAAESWVAEGSPALLEYSRLSADTRDRLVQHLQELTRTLEQQARIVAPNLSAVVGPVVAGRLLATAGGLEPLSRMTAARIQLLGARRRFGPGRTPRFGILYHAEGMGDVPSRRMGAFARSVAALAAIAVRVDATSRRPIATELLRRRARRIVQLRRSGP